MADELKKRTWHYVQKPAEYEIACDKCNGTNIDWSEFEHMIWCHDCKIDTRGNEGIFGGPIPVQLAGILGMSFDRYEMEKKEIHKFINGKNGWDYIPYMRFNEQTQSFEKINSEVPNT